MPFLHIRDSVGNQCANLEHSTRLPNLSLRKTQQHSRELKIPRRFQRAKQTVKQQQQQHQRSSHLLSFKCTLTTGIINRANHTSVHANCTLYVFLTFSRLMPGAKSLPRYCCPRQELHLQTCATKRSQAWRPVTRLSALNSCPMSTRPCKPRIWLHLQLLKHPLAGCEQLPYRKLSEKEDMLVP